MSQFIEMFGDFHNKVQIKDVCLVVSGKSIPTKLEDIDGNNPYIKVADFNIPGNEKYITIAQRYVSDDSASYSKQIPEGSVIFAKNGAASMSNKKRLTKIRCCIDMNTMAVFPKNESILSDFLFATIEAMDVSSHVRQGAIPSISPKSIEDSYIAMPTMEEQYRYVSIAKHADKSGFDGFKSQFIEMFGNQDVNDRSWNESIVKDEFTLTMGKTPARNNPAFWQSGTNKWISISDMARYGRYTEDTQESITDIAVAESGIKIVPKGTIIMSFKLSIGRTAVTSEDIYTNEAIMAFRDVDETKFNMTFLQFLIANKNWLLNAKQAVKGQTLNKESIGNARIIVPPIGLQEQFAAIYNQADKSGSVGLKSGLNFAKLLIHR